MFDFAWSHFALLFIIAVILLGPKELPTVLRFIGRWVGKIRQHKSEFQEYFDAITVDATRQEDQMTSTGDAGDAAETPLQGAELSPNENQPIKKTG